MATGEGQFCSGFMACKVEPCGSTFLSAGMKKFLAWLQAKKSHPTLKFRLSMTHCSHMTRESQPGLQNI